MLDRIELENFKASRDVDVRLAALTVLGGLNSSGKSTLLQAIGALRQSYDSNGRTDGFSLSGELLQLGKYSDVLTEGSAGDAVGIAVSEAGVRYRWVFGGRSDAKQLQCAGSPSS